MKKSRIFLATGALALAISAVFATKANKKFASVLTAAAISGNNDYKFTATGQSIFTTSSGTPQLYAELVTASNTAVVAKIPLQTIGSNHHPVYFK
jgi:hypothetical protein